MKVTFAAMCLVLLSSVATSAGISTDHDSEADFSKYKTFAWQEGTHAKNELMHKRIVRAIEKELVEAGWTATDGEADVHLVYHVALNQDRRIEVDDFGYWSRWRRPGFGGSEVTVFDVNVGTLIIDILDAGSGDAVWRGMAQKDLPPTPDPDKMEKKLGKILRKMFHNFPPE